MQVWERFQGTKWISVGGFPFWSKVMQRWTRNLRSCGTSMTATYLLMGGLIECVTIWWISVCTPRMAQALSSTLKTLLHRTQVYIQMGWGLHRKASSTTICYWQCGQYSREEYDSVDTPSLFWSSCTAHKYKNVIDLILDTGKPLSTRMWSIRQEHLRSSCTRITQLLQWCKSTQI